MSVRHAILRSAASLGLVMLAGAASAEPMNADQARSFVVGRIFSFTCFDGTYGVGRINNDGSVVGKVRMQGNQPERHVTMPADTVRVRGEAVCAFTKGASFEPCFDLHKISTKSFRGNLAGVPNMWCEFNRTGGPGGGKRGVASRSDAGDAAVTGSTGRKTTAQLAD